MATHSSEINGPDVNDPAINGPAINGPAIEVDRLTVRRGGRTVLDGIGFSCPPGSITGLLGPSGSGKTTLIRALVGVQIITDGTVTMLGMPAGSAALRSRVGYVTQSPSVYSDLSVAENVRYFAAVFGLGTAEADRAIDDVGLSTAARQVTGSLSGGQRSRVSLACALVARPEVLILDEPTVGQDPLLREDLWDRFHTEAAGGTTVIVSSHVMDEANRCDRLLLLREGTIIADGTPADILSRAGTDSMDEAFLSLIRHSMAGGRSTDEVTS
ncbi:ABC transporter ATP-binding protein [Nakamurella silvestris]|nr:ABC transporter ATP-binding protein [Nakamurella silvestris]